VPAVSVARRWLCPSSAACCAVESASGLLGGVVEGVLGVGDGEAGVVEGGVEGALGVEGGVLGVGDGEAGVVEGGVEGALGVEGGVLGVDPTTLLAITTPLANATFPLEAVHRLS